MQDPWTTLGPRILLSTSSQCCDFVVEVNDKDVKLNDHVPRVLTQLYAAATKLKYGSHLHLPILQS